MTWQGPGNGPQPDRPAPFLPAAGPPALPDGPTPMAPKSPFAWMDNVPKILPTPAAPKRVKATRSVPAQVWRGIRIASLIVFVLATALTVWSGHHGRVSDHDKLAAWWIGLPAEQQTAMCSGYAVNPYGTVAELSTAFAVGRGTSKPTDVSTIDHFLGENC